MGESFSEIPVEFQEFKDKFESTGIIEQFGYAPSREEYFKMLGSCHFVVSTAIHEFFGVSVNEAI